MFCMWDRAKDDKVIREHGIRFDDAVHIFDDVYSWMQTGLYQRHDGDM